MNNQNLPPQPTQDNQSPYSIHSKLSPITIWGMINQIMLSSMVLLSLAVLSAFTAPFPEIKIPFLELIPLIVLIIISLIVNILALIKKNRKLVIAAGILGLVTTIIGGVTIFIGMSYQPKKIF